LFENKVRGGEVGVAASIDNAVFVNIVGLLWALVITGRIGRGRAARHGGCPPSGCWSPDSLPEVVGESKIAD
jgi:hypothetical protein